MKYFILFSISFLGLGCFEPLLLEEDSNETYREVDDNSPAPMQPTEGYRYNYGCGAEVEYNDILGNTYYLPILCQEYYIDTGRPADKSLINYHIDNYEPHSIDYKNKSFSPFEG